MAPAAPDRFRLFGDFRLRLEQDWDSRRGDGGQRDDRLRLRVRLRGGAELHLGSHWSLAARLRTGSHLSQQSPHVTIHDFDGGPEGPYQVDFDRWIGRYAAGGFVAWAGRNELSLWRQDDLFVSGNVTFVGSGARLRHRWGERRSLTVNANYVALPAGMRELSGRAVVGQLVYDVGLGDDEASPPGLTVAAAYWESRADPADPDGEVLLTDNDLRDYRVASLQLQYRTSLLGKGLRVGLDWLRNLESYSRAPAGSFSRFHRDDVDGAVVAVLWGDDQEAGDWMFGLYLAHLEALSVHSSYNSDDFVRWGNSDQVRGTNLEGVELRVRRALGRKMSLLLRAFVVDALERLEPGDVARETGNRVRIDWNVEF